MDQIAVRANVGKGTLYLYYKDKEALFNYLAQECLGSMRAFIFEVESRKLGVMEEIHEVIYNLLKFRREQKFLYRVMQEAKDFKTKAAVQAEQMFDDTIAGYIEMRLRTAIDQGVVKPCNPAVLSFVVIKVYTALAFEWEEKHEPLNEEQIAESVGVFLKEGLILKAE